MDFQREKESVIGRGHGKNEETVEGQNLRNERTKKSRRVGNAVRNGGSLTDSGGGEGGRSKLGEGGESSGNALDGGDLQ